MTKPFVVTADVVIERPNGLAAEADVIGLLRGLLDEQLIQGYTIRACEPGEGQEGA